MGKVSMEEMSTLDLSSTPEPESKEKIIPNAEDVAIDIVDDTPPEDRGKEPMTANPEADEDELASYSGKVKNRIEKLTRAFHDERRAKEQAAREAQEALNYANSIVEKNKKLVQTSNTNSNLLHETWKSKAQTDLENARAKYKAAYETGDSDAIVAAQEDLNRATMRHEIAKNQTPPLQVEPERVQSKPDSVYTAPPPDPKAETWAAENPWFRKDRQMTSVAYAVHEELIEAGVHPERDANKYYAEINKVMRKRFPDYDWGESEEKPRQRPSTVVAPVTRTTSGKRVSLTQTQVAIAKRLNIPLAEYAKQVAALQGGNNG